MATLGTYSQYRASTKQLYASLLNHATQDLIMKAGHLLGFVQRGTVVLEHDADSDFLMDCVMHEPVDGSASLVVQAIRNHWRTDVPNQAHLLAAMEGANTSLYTVEATHPDRSELILCDQFDSTRPEIVLTDFQMSRTALLGALLFTRILTFGDLNMTSGIAMPFAANLDGYLRRRLKPMEHKIHSSIPAVQRYAAFYRLYRTDGLAVRFDESPMV